MSKLEVLPVVWPVGLGSIAGGVLDLQALFRRRHGGGVNGKQYTLFLRAFVTSL
ncbi:hypothetical protein V8E51_017844 [Hyaloscypha variabilis]